jgi:cyanophycin synthetase
MAPGRFNRLEVDGVELVLDYAHNAAAMQALGEAVNTLDARRTHVVMGLPGDRRDEDLLRTLDASKTFAHSYVFHDLKDARDREPGEVPRLLSARVAPGTAVDIAPTQLEALRRVWRAVRPGDRIVVVVDDVDETLAAVQALADEEACTFPVAATPYAPADRHVGADRAW